MPAEPFASKPHVDGRQPLVSVKMANMDKRKLSMAEHKCSKRQQQQSQQQNYQPTNEHTRKGHILQLPNLTPYLSNLVYIPCQIPIHSPSGLFD